MNKHTQIMVNWLNDVIISLDICPFAKNEFSKIKIIEADFTFHKLEKTIESYIKKDITSAIFFNLSQITFEDLYSLSQRVQKSLIKKKKDFQLIAFHPRFQFQDTQFEDRINLVNRSPYPTLHLLSNKEIDKVSKDQNIGVKINNKNEQMLESMSDREIRKYFSYLKDK